MAVSGELVERLLAEEKERFALARPRSAELAREARAVMPNGVPASWQHLFYDHAPVWVAEGHGASFSDVDGHSYADFNIADTSVFCGHAPEPTVRAVAARLALGGQFLLPSEDATWVASELGRRYALPAWQFTLAATSANVEALRLARHATGRPDIVLFDGYYHGAADEFFAITTPEGIVSEHPGIRPSALADVRIVPFNDPEALALALADEQVACVLTEPAMTNNQGVIQPAPGFHDALRRATRETGTLLVLDETHTQICAPGGLTQRLGLEPDIVTLGKSIGGGIPVGAYGMTRALATEFERDGWYATGGTLFGSALQMAACRATLAEVLVDGAYERAAALGERVAAGIEQIAGAAGLPWRAHRLAARSGYCFGGTQPVNAVQARADLDRRLWSLLRVWHANRGVWEAIEGAGPASSVAMGDAEVDRYLESLSGLVAALTA
ncbi:MAG TPA: aminotransferase class III-fold pyridoxal phosphate-dependent enzyme [Gaiellales bacterium]